MEIFKMEVDYTQLTIQTKPSLEFLQTTESVKKYQVTTNHGRGVAKRTNVGFFWPPLTS